NDDGGDRQFQAGGEARRLAPAPPRDAAGGRGDAEEDGRREDGRAGLIFSLRFYATLNCKLAGLWPIAFATECFSANRSHSGKLVNPSGKGRPLCARRKKLIHFALALPSALCAGIDEEVGRKKVRLFQTIG